MRINTNVSALSAARNLTNTQNAVAASTQKLSSGFRITRAADDAAGLGTANVLALFDALDHHGSPPAG